MGTARDLADLLDANGDVKSESLDNTISLGDNVKAQFGASNDLQIYHDGSNSRIQEVGTGNLVIRASAGTYIQGVNGENGVVVLEDGATSLWNDGSQKLVTTSTGITVAGAITANASVPQLTLSDTDGTNQYSYINSNNGNLSFTTRNNLSHGSLIFNSNNGTTTEERMRINSSGNVGIGTSSPQSKLDVRGDITTNGSFEFQHYESGWGANATRPWLANKWSAGAGDYLQLVGTGNQSNTLSASMSLSDNYGVLFGKGKDTLDGSMSTEHMRIDNSGNVGIGATSPTSGYKLDVKGNIILSAANPEIRFNNGGAWLDNGGAANTLRVGTAGAERMRINSSGNVGIGTSSPSAKLDVNGDTQASGHIKSTGGAGYLLGETTLRSAATFTLSTSAQDIYQESSNLIGTGTYLLKIFLSGSGWYSETWSGIFQFYGGTTNDANATDIYLTGAGHANVSGRQLYARFKRYVGNNSNHGLQVWTNSAGNGTNPYITIDVKRLF